MSKFIQSRRSGEGSNAQFTKETILMERERTNRKEETVLQMRELKTLDQRMSTDNTQDSGE